MVEKAKIKAKARAEKGRGKLISSFVVISIVLSVLTASVAMVSADPPLPEQGQGIRLTAYPETVPADGVSTSDITATVINKTSGEPVGVRRSVRFNITGGPGILTELGNTTNTGQSITIITDEITGNATALINATERGTATILAYFKSNHSTSDTTEVEFIWEYEVELTPDEQSKETDANVNATYYITVRNNGSESDTYDLSITDNDADHAGLNKSKTATLASGESEVVELNVSSFLAGNYDTTVNASSANASAEVTVTTTVRAFYGVELKVEGGDYAEKPVATDENATYALTVTNLGNTVDSYDLDASDNPNGADIAELNRTTITNLAAGASAEVLLNVSDAIEGEYVVNVTVTSQGDPTKSDKVMTKTIVGADADAPVVTNPNASPATILNDNGRPRPPGTNISQLNVTVTDAGSGVSTVTIDLSPIGGSATQDMTNIGGNVWSVETSATAGINLTHNLAVNATDNAGYSNTSVSISLTVLRRGDIVRDDKIDMKDMLYIARYTAQLEPEWSNPPSVFVGDVVGSGGNPLGDGVVNMKDALYIARWTVMLEDEP